MGGSRWSQGGLGGRGWLRRPATSETRTSKPALLDLYKAVFHHSFQFLYSLFDHLPPFILGGGVRIWLEAGRFRFKLLGVLNFSH